MELKYDKIIYIISGTCGVGKSSISNKLAEKYRLSAHINADNLYHMVVGGYNYSIYLYLQLTIFSCSSKAFLNSRNVEKVLL